ncbi:uncharacterized protein LOC112466660 [Temnothorax curvispinosus]|uniref:Uncharacterized protein LOC112466660 n=1 Tax=Temnothorax curvispinosus TaxID=300111 RepID=A0A6J1R7M1_9HYME|nr:uncharacterized protein LOC112466660 [Temnothorax curvispinosus]
MAFSVDSRTQLSLQATTNELLQSLGDRLAGFIESQQRTNKEITDKLSDLSRIADIASQNSKRIVELEQTVSALEREVGEFRNLRSAQSISTTDKHIDNELVISGVPAALPITPARLIQNVFESLDVKDLSCHILNVRSMVRKTHKAVGPDCPPRTDETGSIAVTLSSGAVQRTVLLKARAKRELKQSEVCGNDSNRNIHVNEMLSKATYDLLQLTRRTAKDKSYKFVWMKSRRICIRLSEGKPIINIDSKSDLVKLV